MKKILKETYGVWVLIFYFLKWPYFLGFPYLYFEKGLTNNWFLNLLWAYCAVLIVKDFLYLVKNGFRCTKDQACEIEDKNER